ncbi:hypothetical protein PSPO01_00932 [Paraphaeosphaeria sporulosa]
MPATSADCVSVRATPYSLIAMAVHDLLTPARDSVTRTPGSTNRTTAARQAVGMRNDRTPENAKSLAVLAGRKREHGKPRVRVPSEFVLQGCLPRAERGWAPGPALHLDATHETCSWQMAA